MSAARFVISSFCHQGGCVAVAVSDDGGDTLVRQDVSDAGPTLKFTASEWDAFVAGVKDGEFDRTS